MGLISQSDTNQDKYHLESIITLHDLNVLHSTADVLKKNNVGNRTNLQTIITLYSQKTLKS